MLRNDEMKWADLRPHLGMRMCPHSHSLTLISAEFDNIILSSGPGSASDEADVGICNELLHNATIPVRYLPIHIAPSARSMRIHIASHSERRTSSAHRLTRRSSASALVAAASLAMQASPHLRSCLS